MAAAQNINPETSGLRERFAALTGAKDLAHPLDPELLEVARIRLPYDEIAENVRALHPLPYNISTREVMLLCERFQQLFGAHLEIISARASTLQNLSAFTDHIVDLPEVDFDDHVA